MFIAALFIVPNWIKTEVSLWDERINKMGYVHVAKYYSVIKWNEVLIPAITWVNLERIMLSKWSQLQKSIYYMILFIWTSKIGKYTEIENRQVIVLGCGVRRWVINNIQFLFWVDKNVLKLIVIMVAHISEYIENYWIVYFKRGNYIP